MRIRGLPEVMAVQLVVFTRRDVTACCARMGQYNLVATPYASCCKVGIHVSQVVVAQSCLRPHP